MKSRIIAKPVETTLRYGGFWPGYFAPPYLSIIIWLSSLHLIFQYWDIAAKPKTVITVMSFGSDFAATALFYIKFAITWSKRRIVREMVAEILADFEKAEEVNVKRIMADKQRFVHGFFVITICAYSATASFFIMSSILSYRSAKFIEEREFFVHASFPFKSKVSPIFEIICCIQLITMSSFIVGVVLVNSLYLLMVLHASARLEIITEEIIQFSSLNTKKKDKRQLFKSIKNVVNAYQEVLSFCIKTEDVFSYQILIEVIFSTLLLCFTGYISITLVEQEVDIFIILKFVLFLTLPLCQMAYYSYAGEFLRTKSESIQNAAYDCEWYNMQSTTAKAILFIMLRSQKPITLTAGKFMDMSVSNYANILKASISYLSVLRTVGEKKNFIEVS